MENTESKKLQESLDKVAQSLIFKLQKIELNLPVFPSVNTKADVSGGYLNVGKIIIGGMVTGSLGYAIAHFTNGDEKLYAGIGALIGIVSLSLTQKKKQSLKTESKEIAFDYNHYRKEILNKIRKGNEQIRQDWETAMKQLNESQRNQIELMVWTDEQKEVATSNVLVYKSVIIRDYHYTDAIEDVVINEDFSKNLNLLFIKWKDSITDIINNTKTEQWNSYFSKVYS